MTLKFPFFLCYSGLSQEESSLPIYLDCSDTPLFLYIHMINDKCDFHMLSKRFRFHCQDELLALVMQVYNPSTPGDEADRSQVQGQP